MNHPENINTGGGALSLARELALQGSHNRYWEEDAEQKVWLQRRATLNSPDHDTIETIFEAHKFYDQRGRLSSLYRIRVEGMRELISEELPSNVKAMIDHASVASSQHEEIMAIPSMSEGDDFDDEADDRAYLHNVSVEYRMDGRGQLIDRVHQDTYWVDEEELVMNRLSVPGRKSIKDEFSRAMADVPTELPGATTLMRPRTELRADMKFFDIIGEHRNNPREQRLSDREHRQSMVAVMSFILLRGEIDPIIELL